MAEQGNAVEIRGLCLDVDGVLTDGGLYVDDEGCGTRRFNVHDGFALYWYRKIGGQILVCSGKDSRAVAHRAKELGIEHVIQGSRDKLNDVKGYLPRLGLSVEQLAVMGDDLPDVPLMRAAGLPIAVANAAEEVKQIARMVTERPGGAGAVREAVEHLMRESGRWAEVLKHYGL